jgi:membrane protein implicated in regulation of membrane protease activity
VRLSSSAVLTIYLAALIFGLGMFAVQLFASSDAHDSGHAPLPGGADLHVGAGDGSTVGQGLELHGQHGAGDHGGWADLFLSLRFYMFAAIGFGAVGAPVTWIGSSGSLLTLVVALATGIGIGCLAALGFRVLGRETLSSNGRAEELIGQVGRVLLACEKGKKGKVRLTVRGQIVDVVATTDEPRLAPGSGIIVQEVYAQRVHVCAAPSELLPE